MKFIQGWNADFLQEKPFISELLNQINPASSLTEIQLVQKIIEKVIRAFDAKDCLYGIFQAMSNHRVSPFVATHDYCVRVNTCDQFGNVQMNISPIYHLGLDYPNNYKTKHGKDLDQEAIIGLLETPVVGTLPPGHTAYSYGVDAGILFRDSKISHNKNMEIKLEEIHEGLLVTLSCDNQTTSTTLSWEDVGVHSVHAFDVRERDTLVLRPEINSE